MLPCPPYLGYVMISCKVTTGYLRPSRDMADKVTKNEIPNFKLVVKDGLNRGAQGTAPTDHKSLATFLLASSRTVSSQ